MKKIDWNKVYLERIKQIDIDIKKAISKKHWGMRNLLEIEKAKINKCLTKGE